MTTEVSSAAAAPTYDFDYVVIGGGSAGLASAKEAKKLGATVALLDFVKPSPHGTTWGLGGTCPNVGCIPKKLFHQASLLHKAAADAREFGWNVPQDIKNDWEVVRDNIQNHVGSLTFGYRTQLREKGVEYINAFGTFKDAHTIVCTDRKGKQKSITGKYIAVAIGGRPKQLDIPGWEHAVTSDDIFSLEKAPGKTLVVGASYVAMECAGFLTGLGYDTSLMVRSIFLRGFDQQMAELAADYMAEEGTKMLRNCVPTKIEKREEDGKLRVTWKKKLGDHDLGEETDTFDTVLVAVGRTPVTGGIGLEAVGVALNEFTGHVIVNEYEQTTVDHIYALGDCIKGGLELTPVAIMAGKLLARRLFAGGKRLMQYQHVPTAVFTPLEYGCVGLSEDAAIEKFGEDDIEVYHSFFQPLEFTVPHRPENQCYAKIICRKSDDERVLGIHILSPNAGEIIQAHAVALKMGVTKAQLDETVGIHPTVGEELLSMDISKSSGDDPKRTGC